MNHGRRMSYRRLQMLPRAAPTARSIAALVTDPLMRARLGGALDGLANIAFYEQASELAAAVAAFRPTAVITQLRDRHAAALLPTIRVLRAQFPFIPVFAYVQLTSEGIHDLVEAAQAGISDALVYGVDDSRFALKRALARATGTAIEERVLTEIRGLVPPSLHHFFAYCVHHTDRPLSVSAVARAIGVHRKTVAHRLSTAGLPAASVIIGWCRLIQAAGGLEDTGRPVEQVAYELDFPSASSLRNMLKRYLDLRPSDLRQRGAVDCALGGFHRALTSARQAQHSG
jgi:AraC-like DNA-binding protein